MNYDYEALFEAVARRYRGVTPEVLKKVLCPLLIPLESLDKEVRRPSGQSHYSARFLVKIGPRTSQVLWPGCTGKFVPAAYAQGQLGAWREVAKGRILSVDEGRGLAEGEVYVGRAREALHEALDQLSEDDYWEVDQYGASAKILSSLVECCLAEKLSASGYSIVRMPEDVARHIGKYYDFDFLVRRGGESRRIEVKSLWGTNTEYARLIHSKGTRYPTSSCRFDAQDLFAVSLFLRTGSVSDFAFARSVPEWVEDRGLPSATNYPEHVNQNPRCALGDGTWFATLAEVWN